MGRVALFDYLLLRGLGEAVSGPSYVAVQESKILRKIIKFFVEGLTDS
jgi:hypothetical protein